MFPAVGTLPLTVLNLMIVALVADLILAIAWVEVLLEFLQVHFAHITDVWSLPYRVLILTILSRSQVW